MTLVAKTTHGDLDLSFGSVIRDSREIPLMFPLAYMVIGVRNTLEVDAIVVTDGSLLGRPALIPWKYINEYEQVP